MPQRIKQTSNKIKRKLRVRKKISGTSDRPRLSVYRTNKYTLGQLIDDKTGTTVASLSMKDIKDLHKGATKVEAAHQVGLKLAEVALTNKIKSVVFDRNGVLYHGRVKSFADGAREGGLEF